MEKIEWTRARGWVAAIWLVCVLLLGIKLAYNLGDDVFLNSSILSLLPDSVEVPIQGKRTNDDFSQSLVFAFSATTANRLSVDKASSEFAIQLRNSGAFTQVTRNLLSEDIITMISPYIPFRFQLLSSEDRAKLRINETGNFTEEVLRKIYSPIPEARFLPIQQDPFDLFGRWLRNFPLPPAPQADGSGLYAEKDGQFYRFVFATFEGDAFDLDNQKLLLDKVNNLLSKIDSNTINVASSGLLFHAAAGADQAISEISTIGVGSLVGIVLLLGILFRRVSIIGIAFLPVAVGCLVAISLSLSIFNQLHVITLVFGASLVGVSIDYLLHFLCAPRESNGEIKIYRALTLGLVSSVTAYFTFVFTPFPGLQQMAVFSILGLIAAWITVLVWLPYLVRQPLRLESNLAAIKRIQDRVTTRLPYLILVPLGFASVLAVSVATSVTEVAFRDDIRDLNTSPRRLLDNEKIVQSLLNPPQPGQYFVVSGNSLEDLLQGEEALTATLDTLIQQKTIASYQALSTYLPSKLRQKDNLTLLRSLYTHPDGLTTFAETIGINEYPLLVSQLDAKSNRLLDFDEWKNWSVAKYPSNLLLDSDVSQNGDNNSFQSMVTLYGNLDRAGIKELQSTATTFARVEFMDYPQFISELLTSYSIEISKWLVGIYLMLTMFLAFRFRWFSIWVVGTPALATFAALGCLTLLGQPFSLFHVLAAVLVLGIGLDMGIFLQESRAAPHALIAITASAITTVLAFGLLALSQTPALHFFGQMALFGISFSWLIAVCSSRIYFNAGTTKES
jgi:predicted exporter